MDITGLSMAARAHRIILDREAERLIGLLLARYPVQKTLPTPMEPPKPADIAVFRVDPHVISILDYSKGFGHTDLVLP